MRHKLIAVLATAVALLFLVALSAGQAAAQRGGRDGGGPSMGGGGRGGGPSVGGGRGPSGPGFQGGGPSDRRFSGDGGRGFVPRFDRRDGRGHVRRFRGDRFFFDAPVYGSYGYGPCSYYYDRAVATGSGYWWNRYYACTGEY